MDKSMEYVQMCNNQLIQLLWEPQPGDFVYTHMRKKEIIVLGYDWIGVKAMRESGHLTVEFACAEEKFEIAKELPSPSVAIKRGTYIFVRLDNPVWLPRQDQIQELIINSPLGEEQNFGHTFVLVYALYDFAEEIRVPGEDYPFDTLEKLWLAFYMWKEHRLRWDSELKAWMPKIKQEI